MSLTFSASTSRAQASRLKGNVKELSRTLREIESELQTLMGTVRVEIRGAFIKAVASISDEAKLSSGIQQHGRIAPNDKIEVLLEHGEQKFKAKMKQKTSGQVWDRQDTVFKCLLDSPLTIKVSVKGVGKCENETLFRSLNYTHSAVTRTCLINRMTLFVSSLHNRRIFSSILPTTMPCDCICTSLGCESAFIRQFS